MTEERTATSVGYLYVTVNQVDGTHYIGQSTRLDDHSIATYLGSGDLFVRALDEFGVENFEKFVIGYFDDPTMLAYAEVCAIAKLRADDVLLYNAGVGGPRWQLQFIRAMVEQFGVSPRTPDAWFDAVMSHPAEVKRMLAESAATGGDTFYFEYEAQLRQTQDLSGECPSCGSVSGSVCRTKTGNPTKNHAKRARAV